MQTVMKSYCGSDVGFRRTQLLPQALCQGRHRVLGGRVEMYVSHLNDTMSAHATEKKMYELCKRLSTSTPALTYPT